MPSNPRNVYLVGPMGSGKTTIGQRLARRLGLAFHDCDQEIEARTGASVNLIFDVEGEAGFRRRETEMLRELTARAGVLVATGGGAVLSEPNRKMLRETGTIVYLKASVAQQLERLKLDRSRPLLQSEDRAGRLAALAEERDPLYGELADLVFPAMNRNIDSAVERIAQAIASFRRENAPAGAADSGLHAEA